MKINWIVETGIKEDEEQRLIDSIKKLDNTEVYEIKYVPFSTEIHGRLPLESSHTIYHGSLQGSKNIKKYTSYTPGAFNNDKAMTFASYRGFMEFPLNGDGILVPFKAIPRIAYDWDEDWFFVKPNSARKLFTGQTVHKKNVEDFMNYVTTYEDIDDYELCMMCEKKEIIKEVRAIVLNSTVITYCCYSSNDKDMGLLLTSREEKELNNIMDLSVEEFNPCPVWVLDMALTNEGWFVLEVGAFSACGLYQCDTDIIAREVTAHVRNVISGDVET